MGEKLDKVLSFLSETKQEAVDRHNQEEYEARCDIEENITRDCGIKAVAMMIECNVPENKIEAKLIEYWNLRPSEAQEMYLAGKKKVDIKAMRIKMDREKAQRERNAAKQKKSQKNNKSRCNSGQLSP